MLVRSFRGIGRIGKLLIAIGLLYAAWAVYGDRTEPLFVGLGLAALGYAFLVFAKRPAAAWRKWDFWIALLVWGGLWKEGGFADPVTFVEENPVVFAVVVLALAWSGLRTTFLGTKRRTGQFSTGDQPGG